MRLDSYGENWHPAYAGRVHCYLNGEKVEDVRVADEEAGTVTRLRPKENGPQIVGDMLVEETLYGDVKIVFDEPPEILIKQYNICRAQDLRDRWRERLNLDSLPMDWREFGRKARQYAQALNAGCP